MVPLLFFRENGNQAAGKGRLMAGTNERRNGRTIWIDERMKESERKKTGTGAAAGAELAGGWERADPSDELKDRPTLDH